MARICRIIRGSNQLINVPAMGVQLGQAILERGRMNVNAERRNLVNAERGNSISLN